MMGKAWWRNEWLAQLAIALGYALVYIAIHPISDAHWPLRSGLRLSCLLLLPYRYWPALLVAEALPNAYEVIPCLDSFGIGFVVVRCIPPILFFMPIVWWCRDRLALFPAQRLVDVKIMMLCVVMITVAWTGYCYLAISFVHTPTFHAMPIMALSYFIGNYIAILCTVPIALMASTASQSNNSIANLSEIFKSRLTRDIFLFVFPLLVALAIVRIHNLRNVDHIVRTVIGQYGLAWFLPVGWITLKHGWRAAVIGGALAITAVCLVTASRADLDIIEIQGLVALACTCLLIAGAHISAQLRQHAITKDEGIRLRHAAQRQLQINEQRRRQLSQSLEYLAGTLYLTNSSFTQKLRRIMPNADVDSCYKQLVAARNEVYALAESQYPLVWRERGLPAALEETIGRALDEAGITYSCTINGRGFTRISPVVLNTAYRIACEAVTQVTKRLTCSGVYLTLRGGETNGRRWLVLRVKGVLDDERITSAVMQSSERKRIAVKLGASALDVDQLRMQTRLFDGVLHDLSWDKSTCLTILLQDVTHSTQGAVKENMPLRLWVC